jgi:hypothetical protein
LLYIAGNQFFFLIPPPLSIAMFNVSFSFGTARGVKCFFFFSFFVFEDKHGGSTRRMCNYCRQLRVYFYREIRISYEQIRIFYTYFLSLYYYGPRLIIQYSTTLYYHGPLYSNVLQRCIIMHQSSQHVFTNDYHQGFRV